MLQFMGTLKSDTTGDWAGELDTGSLKQKFPFSTVGRG